MQSLSLFKLSADAGEAERERVAGGLQKEYSNKLAADKTNRKLYLFSVLCENFAVLTCRCAC